MWKYQRVWECVKCVRRCTEDIISSRVSCVVPLKEPFFFFKLNIFMFFLQHHETTMIRKVNETEQKTHITPSERENFNLIFFFCFLWMRCENLHKIKFMFSQICENFEGCLRVSILMIFPPTYNRTHNEPPDPLHFSFSSVVLTWLCCWLRNWIHWKMRWGAS